MSSLPRSCQRVGKHLQSRVRTAPQKAYNKLTSCLGNDHSKTQEHAVTTAPELEDVASSQTRPSSYSKDEYTAAIERQANNWRDFAADMSSRFEAVKSELDKAVKNSALELDRHQCRMAEVEQLLSSAHASAGYFQRSAAESEFELTSKQVLLKESEQAQDLLSSKLVSQAEDSSSMISSLNATIVELQGAASGLQATLASKDSAAAAADIKHKEELEALHLAHRAQTKKLSQIQAEVDREHMATKGELEHAETALAHQKNAVADAQAQVHFANQRVQDSINITTDLRSEVSHLKTLLEDKAGKTMEAQQQHEAAETQSAAQMANLKTRMDTELAALRSQLESEQKRRVAADEQHKAAQADLALASGVAEQLKSDQAVLLTEASKSESTINGLGEQAAQLQAALTAQSKETAAVAQLAKAQQQQMDLNMADLSGQLESERCRCAKAVADYKAAQADLAEQLACASGTAQQLKSQNAELASQAMKVKELTDQAAQLQTALTAAHAKSAAAGQHAQVHQQLEALRADHTASVDNNKVVRAELEAAKLQVSTLKAELVMSCEAADSARGASDSLAQRMRTSADTELLKVVQKVETAETELDHLRGMLANTEADAKSEAAKLQVLLEKSQANVVSAEQGVKRLEQQLAGSQTAAAQQQEELKKLHQTELKSQAMKDALNVKDLTDQAAQLQAALKAANDKAGAEAAAAAQNTQAHQQQLEALRADHTASADNKVVRAELEAAKLQVSTLKAELDMSHDAADSARAASDSLAQQMRTSADTELLKVVQKVDAAEAEAHRLQCLLANTEADGKSEVAKMQLFLEESQANVASAEQVVKRLEQQLAGSQTAAAQQQEELKKLHKAELKSEASQGLRMWEDVCDEAAQLRTDLRRAKDKSEAEAQDAADYASKLHQQTIALYDSTKDLHEQLIRQGWRAVEAEATAEQEATELRAQLAAAQASHESAEQDVKRLEQQLAGIQAAAAPKEQELVTQAALTQEQASKLQGQLIAALVDLNSLPGMVRSAWFERNRVTAILEAVCDDRDHSPAHMVTQVETIQKLVGALASSCKSVRSELRDAQVDHNKTSCQLETALVEKLETEGRLEKVTKKYSRLKGQHDKALADLSYQQEQEQHNDPLLDAEQPSTELAETQIVQSCPEQQAKQDVTGPWEDAQHIQQQHFPNSHTLDRNSPQGPPVHPPGTHSSVSMVGGDPPVMGAVQQQRPHLAHTLDLPPGFHQQSILANHAAAQAGDNAAAMANGQEDGDNQSAALEAQQQHPKRRGTRAGRISKEHLNRGRNPSQQGDSDNVASQLTGEVHVDDSPAVL